MFHGHFLARQWSFLDDPLDISRNAHIGSSVGAIPRDIGLGRSNPPVDHEDHGLPELSSDIHRDDTDISTEPDLSLNDTDEDDGGDANDRFEDIGPSHVNRSDRMHSTHHAAPVQQSLYDVPEFDRTLEDSERTSEDPFDEQV
ncbi:xylem serine protein 1-like [Dorcoceras hygrometricum]|uniref:Xylem serine protein 1-like n=1 Tax=Dorcoceras hygrometricum TaxID=472368 RepID=A0A2Z7AA79_9LAMI|nr:xylem serine protein 1-like [Dorcoceras hygrometricum]